MVDIYRPSPLMPAGLAMAPLAMDPLAGAGFNFDVWPTFFDSQLMLTPVIITAAELEVFTGGHADLVIPSDRWQIRFPRETRTQIMRSS